jgi:hypothetical protein
MNGGPDPYLCYEDTTAFEGLVVQYVNQMNCLSTCQALDIALFLKKARHAKAAALLESIGSNKLAEIGIHERIYRPDRRWLGPFVQKMGINAMTAESIEEARRHACNERAVTVFFDKFRRELRRSPYLILNCDETHVSSRKQFKVLGVGSQRALKRCREELLHFKMWG